MSLQLPKISVITPSYNQGRFIEQTILSVISQGYPNLEYIIMDGGSTDNTVEVIKKYEKHIAHWQSKKDNGQAAAINEGFGIATGDIVCWLNSDDMYLPGILHKIGAAFTNIQAPEMLFGNSIHYRDASKKTRGSDVVVAFQNNSIALCDYIIQPSSFYTKVAWATVGKLDETLHFSFDWDWFIRAQKANVLFTPFGEYLSLYRIHDAHKSGGGASKRTDELKQIAARYNEPRLAKAFAKWMNLYSKKGLVAKTIDTAQRLNLSFINTVCRLLFFSNLSKKEYRDIVAMN